MSDSPTDPYKKAARLGKVVVLPKPDELFIDIDNEGDACVLQSLLRVARTAGLDIFVDRRIPSATPGHEHVYLRCGESLQLTPTLRIALQAALGSDRKREVLALAAVVRGIEPHSVFFEALVVEETEL